MNESIYETDFSKTANTPGMIGTKIHEVPAPNVFLPRQILLVEDDEDFAALAAKYIEEASGSEVTVSNDPFEAGSIASGKVFDLILTDWRMPGLNGFGVIRRANELLDSDMLAPEGWFEQKTPVIIVTAYNQSLVELEKKPKGRFRHIGTVSKKQSLDSILCDISTMYNRNAGGSMTLRREINH